MNWNKVMVEINYQAVEPAVNIINEAGADGVVLDESGRREIITAYYPDNKYFSGLINNIEERLNKLKEYGIATGSINIEISLVKDEDWSTSWHDFFKPVRAGDSFLISPTWEECSSSNRKIIKIDPGMAFGIGSHETTMICIEFLEEYIDSGSNDLNMLDIGTGTGILAIAAVHLGVNRVTGIDKSQAAVETARENIKINHAEGRIKIIEGDLTEGIDRTFDIIMANLLPDLIIRLIPSVPPLMKKESILILSGIIPEKRKLINAELEKYGLVIRDEKQINEWIGLAVCKK